MPWTVNTTIIPGRNVTIELSNLLLLVSKEAISGKKITRKTSSSCKNKSETLQLRKAPLLIILVVLISCTQPLSNSLIHKLSLWFQHNSTKEPYDINRIVCIGLYEVANKVFVCVKVANGDSGPFFIKKTI